MAKPAHDISGAEVAAWFDPRSTPGMACCEAIAGWINRLIWPSDPKPRGRDVLPAPVPAALTLEWRVWPGMPKQLWDAEKAAEAAKAARKLLKHMPWLLSWAEALENERFPETLDRHDKLKLVRQGLPELLSFIEAPFGHRQQGYTPKDWHRPAIWVAQTIIVEFTNAGLPEPAISQRSAVARVISHALARMGYGTVEPAAIGNHLVAWVKKHGPLVLSE
jgi:hypothetical protein